MQKKNSFIRIGIIAISLIVGACQTMGASINIQTDEQVAENSGLLLAFRQLEKKKNPVFADLFSEPDAGNGLKVIPTNHLPYMMVAQSDEGVDLDEALSLPP